MKCQWCGGIFPHKKGRFCGTCERPTAKLEESPAMLNDLALLVRRLVQQLKKHNINEKLQVLAMDYLKRKGLQGSPLREFREAKND